MASTGNADSKASSLSSKEKNPISNGTDKSAVSLPQRLSFHQKIHEGCNCDLETSASVIANVNIKQLLTPAAFDSLPTKYQNELIKLLPESDRLTLDDAHTPLAMTVTALSNEFFAKSCVEYRDRLRNGEFSSTASNRSDIDPVVWECNEEILRQKLTETGVPKAGEPFTCTPKQLPPSRSSKASKTQKKAKPKPTTTTIKSATVSTKPPATATVKSLMKTKISNHHKTSSSTLKTTTTGIKRAHPIINRSEPAVKKPAATVTAVSQTPTNITKLQKVTETNSTGVKVTKVVPIVVRNPHGQVVTTLANCNPLLSEMIKNPKDTQTLTAAPVKVDYNKRSLLPTILKKNNPVIVTLRHSKTGSNGETVNKAVSEVLAKIQSTQPSNGSSQSKPIIVTVNGSSSNGTTIVKQVTAVAASAPTAAAPVNIERSRQICESSKQNQPTLNLERSYQICKQVLGKTGSPTLVSVVVGPGGKKLITKPVRNRPHQHADAVSGQASSDIALYRLKHHGKPSVTLSGHVFLAMKSDEDGYAIKSYKRKTAYKQKPKKKLAKLSSSRKLTVSPPHSNSPNEPTTSAVSQSNSPSQISSADSRSVTMVTDSVFATQPLVTATETESKPLIPTSGVNSASLLSSCMCNLRALVICQKCGAFSHAECMSKDHCLACLDAEKWWWHHSIFYYIL
mgnify:CR=1 FL=1